MRNVHKIIGMGALLLSVNISSAQQFKGRGGMIADNGTENVYAIDITGTNGKGFSVESVSIDAMHEWTSDLEIRLVSPEGKSTLLFSHQGGDSRDLNNTRFSDNASESITTGWGPFENVYTPMGRLADLNGTKANGSWKLIVSDRYAGQHNGMLIGWSVNIRQNEVFEMPEVIAEIITEDNNTEIEEVEVVTSESITDNNATSVNDTETLTANDIVVYPNPVADQVNINLEGISGAAVITITDAGGRQVLNNRSQAGSNLITIQTQSLSAGIYYINVTAEGTTIVKKIVKA